jgi:hypothetical protein
VQMNTDELRDMLKAQTAAPPANPDRYHEIERRVHGIRRRRAVGGGLAGVAGVAAIALAGTLLNAPADSREPVASGPGTTSEARPSKTEKPPPKAELTKADRPDLKPAQQLWPEAAHVLPLKLPDGRKYEPVGFADPRTVIATTEASFEQVGSVVRYNVDTKQAAEVTRVPIPPGLAAAQDGNRDINLPDDFTVGAGRVSWWMGYADAGSRYVVEIWSAPLTGGPAQRVTQFNPPKGRGSIPALLAVAADQVIWSGSGGEVFAAPLTGGNARQVGPAGSQLVAWPWIGSPSGDPAGEDLEAVEDQPNAMHYRELRNVVTGERRDSARVAGQWSCGVEWCFGTTDKGDAVRKRESSKGQLLPDRGQETMGFMDPVVPMLDRFVIRVTAGGDYYVYDMKTSKGGLLTGQYDKSVSYTYGYPGEQIFSKLFKDHRTVVNLAAIT